MYIEFESGIVKDKPTRRDLNRIGEEEFTILSRSPLNFIQCCINDDPPYGFTVEYQSGSVDKHYRATDEPIELKRVITAFSKYLRGDASWRRCFKWRKIAVGGYDLGEDDEYEQSSETAAERLGETIGDIFCDWAEQGIRNWWRGRKRRQIREEGRQRVEGPKQDARKPIVSVTTDKQALEILGLNASATTDEIRRAYLGLSAQYHPDKVSHLGADLQELAQHKQRLINEAYTRLRG